MAIHESELACHHILKWAQDKNWGQCMAFHQPSMSESCMHCYLFAQFYESGHVMQVLQQEHAAEF